MEISIKLILQEWVRRIWIIALCAIIGLGSAYFYTKYFTTPIYTTNMKVTTLANLNSDQISSTAGNYINELTLAQRRVQTYLELMRTTSFYERVATTSGTGYTPGAVGSMISFSQIEDMGFFYVTITGIDPVAIKAVADAVGQEMFPYIDQLQSDAAITVIEPAKLPTYPISNPAKNNAIKGGLIGAVLAMGVIALIAVFDTHIKDEETLLQRYDIPILGSIPDFTAVTNNKHR